MERIFYNGKILTMAGADCAEEIGNVPEAVLVKDGVIAAVGLRQDRPQLAAENAETTA